MNKPIQMLRVVLAGSLMIALLLGASASQAAEVIQDPAGNAIGISSLEVDGEFFDVLFLWGIGLDVIGLPFDWITPTDAEAAVDAVNLVLAAESTPVTTVGPVANASDFFYVPYDVFGAQAETVRGSGDGSGGWTTTNIGDRIAFSLPPATLWAKFAPVGTAIEDTSWGLMKSLYR